MERFLNRATETIQNIVNNNDNYKIAVNKMCAVDTIYKSYSTRNTHKELTDADYEVFNDTLTIIENKNN